MKFFPSLEVDNYRAVLHVDGIEVATYWLEQVISDHYFVVMMMGVQERVTITLAGSLSYQRAFSKMLEIALQHYEAQVNYATLLYERDRAF